MAFLQIALILICSAALVFGTIYFIQWTRFKRHLARPAQGVAPEILNLWRSDRIQTFLSRNAEPGIAGTISTGHALFHLSRIDSSVLNSVDRVYEPEKLNSFRELVSHLEAKANAGQAAWDGARDNYKGHFGETLIAEQLRMQGHHVEMHENPSHRGSDALVDWQPIQFKSGLGADSILEHRAHYPDIPVVTVTEHSEHFASDPMVDCLDTVSGQAIQDTTSDTMEGAIGLNDFIDGIPVVTAAVSGFRNFRPVIDGHCDFETAIRFTLADTAGVGIGAAAGAKIGGVIGMSLGPIGAALGVAIGGIGGAIGGRLAASAYKNRDLDAAKVALAQAVERYPAAYVAALRQKSIALEGNAKRLHPRFRWGSIVNLSVGDVVRSEGAKALRMWAKYCSKLADQLRDRIAAANQPATASETIEAMGLELVTAGVPEPVYSRNLIAVTASIKAASAAVMRELKKLGRA